ncbi:MAG: hypothetical protein FJ005_03740 [Chloroflexi bacterium]|nr:hypothetical protein [Chloroflexota bacterium]
MTERDYYEELCDYYEVLVGEIPNRNELKEALQKTVITEDLEVFFLLPLAGNITLTELRTQAKLPPDKLHERLKRLASKGLIIAYKTEKDHAYEREHIIFMTEQQVRKGEEGPQRTFFARFFNTLIEGEGGFTVPTKTPFYRVLPAEPAITKSSALRTIDINIVVPDPRSILPIDIITEMVRKDGTLIGVAECFCRKTKKLVADDCGHPRETCFVFNKLAESLIEYGFARKIDYAEAIEILKDCEAHGLVHCVDNCEGQILSLCNCCSCSCILLRGVMRGQTNLSAPSRYVVSFDSEKCKSCKTCIARCPTDARFVVDEKVGVDADRCIGCGLCVTTCTTGSSKIVLRKETEKIYSSCPELYDQIGGEALAAFFERKQGS